jgi:hypothetical protein
MSEFARINTFGWLLEKMETRHAVLSTYSWSGGGAYSTHGELAGADQLHGLIKAATMDAAAATTPRKRPLSVRTSTRDDNGNDGRTAPDELAESISAPR